MPPSAFLPDYPLELEAVVMKALQKAPDQRFANANDMLLALEDAMPGPLEGSFDVQVAEYLRGLFGARASERRTAIRLAQEQADRMRAEASSSSVGTLRAISIDSSESGAFSVSPATGVDGPPPSQRSQPSATPAFVGRKLAVAGAALALVVGGVALRLSPAPPARSSAAAAGPLSSELLAKPVAAAVTGVAPPAFVPSAKPAEAPPLSSAEKPEHKPTRVVRVPVPQAKPAAAAAPAPAAATPTTPSVPAAPAAASADAWNRGAFGGRH